MHPGLWGSRRWQTENCRLHEYGYCIHHKTLESPGNHEEWVTTLIHLHWNTCPLHFSALSGTNKIHIGDRKDGGQCLTDWGRLFLGQKVHDWVLSISNPVQKARNSYWREELKYCEGPSTNPSWMCAFVCFIHPPCISAASRVGPRCKGQRWPQTDHNSTEEAANSSPQFYMVKGIVCTQKSGL